MRDVGKSRLAMFGGFLAAGLVLAACGGGATHSAAANTTAPGNGVPGDGTTSTTTAGGPGGGRFDLTAFRTCMSGHGITIAQLPRNRNRTGTPPTTTPGDTRPPRGGGLGLGGGFNFANRFNTPPAGVDPTKYKAALADCRSKLPAAGVNPVNNTAFAAYRSCLADHGVKLPAAGGGGTSQPGAINRNDPKVQAALKTCRPLLPAGGFGRNATTTTTAPQA